MTEKELELPRRSFCLIMLAMLVSVLCINAYASGQPFENGIKEVFSVKLPFGREALLLCPPGARVVDFDSYISNMVLWEKKPLLTSMDLIPPRLPMGFSFFSEAEAPTLLDALERVGAVNVTLNGTGIVVGIVDTGVDFAAKALGMDKIAFDENGLPMLIDVDEIGLALTPLNTSIIDARSRLLDTKDKEIIVYVPLAGKARVYIDYYWKAPPIDSKSGVYKFGFFVAYLFPSNYIIGENLPSLAVLVPVILVDSQKAGYYDTCFLDISTVWFTIKGLYYSLGLLEEPPKQSLLDFSFEDEKPLSIGKGVAAIDDDGDGFYDFSLGVVSGYVYDAFGVIKEGANLTIDWRRCWEPLGTGVYPGMDPHGSYVDFFYDPRGHGTTVASIIVGKNTSYYMPSVNGLSKVYARGVAPGAKIAAAMALYAGNVVSAIKWLSGYDFVNNTWVYTGKHKCDIISNSWGVPFWQWLTMASGGGFVPGGDPLSLALNNISLSSNTTLIFAAGNGGPGVSSIALGGTAENVITVGATSVLVKAIYDVYGHLILPKGEPDSVFSWSSRGPCPLGYAKPDIVAPGGFVLAPTNVLGGLGDGSRAVDIFGGTSMATPITAGVVALLLEGAREKNITVSPLEIKSILESTAKDLGYPPEMQGAGMINLLTALQALSNETLRRTSAFLLDIMSHPISQLHEKEFLKLLRELGVEYIEVPVERPAYFEKTVSVKEFNETYITVPLSMENALNNNMSYTLKITVSSSKAIESTSDIPRVILWLGGWVDENGDGKIQLQELRLIDHSMLNGRIVSLYASSSVLSRLKEDGGIVNNSLILFAYSLRNTELNLTVTASLIEELKVNLSSTKVNILSKIFSSPGIQQVELVFKNKQLRLPTTISIPLLLDPKGASLQYTVKASHSSRAYLMGDTLTIPIMIIQETSVRGTKTIGYIILVNNSSDCDLFVGAVGSKKKTEPCFIVECMASHPPSYVAGLEGEYPLPKPLNLRGQLILTKTPGDRSQELLLLVYCIDSPIKLSLKIEPINITQVSIGGRVYFAIRSPKPLGLLEVLPQEKVFFMNTTILYGKYMLTGNEHIRLLSVYTKNFISINPETGIVTISREGNPLSLRIPTPIRTRGVFIPV